MSSKSENKMVRTVGTLLLMKRSRDLDLPTVDYNYLSLTR